MEKFRLDGKVAIVTGATTGIGQAAATGLAEAGADVVVLGRSRSTDPICSAVQAMGRKSLGFQGDISDPHFRDKIVNKTLAHWGRIDILVNSAGITARMPAAHFAESDWDKIIDVNLTSLFRISQRVGRQMIQQKQGKIINIASIMSFVGGINIPAYTASKGGVAQLTKALASEWAQHNVNVNAIAPGYIETEMTRPLQEDQAREREITARIPAQRWGRPEDLIGAVVFLASPASDFVHGHVLVVDGGWMAR
jgi:2-deoxy-D-gluconate 3-dehydrogenase